MPTSDQRLYLEMAREMAASQLAEAPWWRRHQPAVGQSFKNLSPNRFSKRKARAKLSRAADKRRRARK